MRLPFPKSVPLRPLLIFLTAVLGIQILQGTDPVFAILMLLAQIAAAVAFNCLGGMTHMAGAFCLFAILPNATVPEIAHLLLGQPGDYNLQRPLTTAGACAVFFLCVMIAALVVSSFNRPAPFLDHIQFSIIELRVISALAAIFAILIVIRIVTLPEPPEDGTLLAALNHFWLLLLSMSIILATYVRVVTTNGESVMSWYVAFLLIVAIVPGLLIASKLGMLTPLLCWVVVAASFRYRFSWKGIVALAVVALVAWGFVYPFSQNARFPIRDATTLSDKADLILQYIQDPSQFPDVTANAEESSEFGTGSSKVNIVARYSLLRFSDMLIDADLKAGYTSVWRYFPVVFSMVPHALWPDRPAIITSNELGHKAGFSIGDDDTTTGIAIGSPALFFDVGGWLAVLVYALVCFTLFFLAVIRLVGTAGSSVWALVLIGTEGNIAGNCSPAAMFSLVVVFVGMLFVLIAILKTISYLAQTLISRPIS